MTDSLDALANSLDAETALADMDRWEKVAALAEGDSVVCMRRHHADFYRQFFGFGHEQRQQVRQRLEVVRDEGRCPMRDLFDGNHAIG